MSCLQKFTTTALLAGVVCLSLVSIAISSWQYQSDNGDIGDDDYWKSFCTEYPVKYLRRMNIIIFPLYKLVN